MDVASQAGHLFPVGPRHASTQDRLSFEAFCAVPYLKWHLDQIVHSGAAMIRNGLVDERQTLTVNSTAVRDFLGRPMVKAGCWVHIFSPRVERSHSRLERIFEARRPTQ